MSIEALKEQARTHEQKEEWAKAIDLYRKAIGRLEKDDQPDIGLYNRVADLQVRQGQLDAAVENYEKAIDLYIEAELPNNAIAVCKKIVRNMPMRHPVYLRMGQIRGRQGFLTESRQHFLTYAERMQSAGDIDEGLRALGELADLAPDDVEIRLAIAGQMEAHGRREDAIHQLQSGYHAAVRRGLPAEPFEQMLEKLGSAPSAEPPAGVVGAPAGEDPLAGFGEIVLGGEEEPAAAAAPAAPAPAASEEELPVPAAADEDALGGFGEIVIGAEPEVEEEEEAAPLPTFDFGGDEDEEDDEEVVPLPLIGGDDEEEEPLPLLGDGFGATTSDIADSEQDQGAELDAAAFGEREERASAEQAELPEIEFGEIALEPAQEASAEEQPAEEEPAEAEPAEVEDAAGAASALEGAVEEARSEARAEPPATAQEGAPRAPAVPGGLAPRPLRAAGPERDPMGHESLAAHGDIAGAMAALRKLIRNEANNVALRQKMVEYAMRLGDESAKVSAWIELADTFHRLHQDDKARPLYQQALDLDPQNAQALEGLGQTPKPAAGGGDFVDLGSLILDDEEEKTTRFVVAYEEPSGDERADFAKMLSQFKAKVAENLSTDDVKAHQDLGTAYKEMGLVDEAISEFQQALRASANHLPSYELLGQCFMEKGEPEAAVRTLKRALDAPREVEDELLGIYYWLGRAHQQLGNKTEAVEFYDRVFSLDINFADVTERLRALR